MNSRLARDYYVSKDSKMIFLADATGIWAIAGQLSLAIGVMVGALKIWEHFRSPKDRLECLIIQQHFSLPFKPDNLLADFRDKVQTVVTSAVKDAVTRLPLAHEFLREWEGGIANSYMTIESYWTVRVDNLGSRKCTGVRLTIPGSLELAKISRGREKETLVRPSNTFVIGELAARETVYVSVWSSNYSSDSSYSSVNLAHDFGLGKIRPRCLTTRFAAFLGNNLVPFLFFMATFSCCVIIAVVAGMLLFSSMRKMSSPADAGPPSLSNNPASVTPAPGATPPAGLLPP